MSAAQVMDEIEKLPFEEQKRVFVLLAQKVVPQQSPNAKEFLSQKLNFEQACDLVFHEHRDLLRLLAK